MATQLKERPITAEVNTFGADKVVRYGWTVKDQAGDFKYIEKGRLLIDATFQRDAIHGKVLEIASTWSWMACGALVVAHRDGAYSVVDGQHRKLAADKRSDIKTLPCLVFETEDVKQEARGFLDLNAGRKPVSAVAKHRARVATGEDLAIFVDQSFAKLSLKLNKSATSAGEIGSVAWAYRRAAEDRSAYELVLGLAAELCAADGIAVAERLLDGLWYLNANMRPGLENPKLVKRIKDVGAKRLLDAAIRAAAYFARGGARVFGAGMLETINKGLHRKYEFQGAPE